MTPEERAEKILDIADRWIELTKAEAISQVAAQIKEAVEASHEFDPHGRAIQILIARAVDEAHPKSYAKGHRHGLQTGRAEAYEDAAKICAARCFCENGIHGSDYECEAGEFAEAIRAQAREVAG